MHFFNIFKKHQQMKTFLSFFMTPMKNLSFKLGFQPALTNSLTNSTKATFNPRQICTKATKVPFNKVSRWYYAGWVNVGVCRINVLHEHMHNELDLVLSQWLYNTTSLFLSLGSCRVFLSPQRRLNNYFTRWLFYMSVYDVNCMMFHS